MTPKARAIFRSARIAELKAAASLVERRQPVRLLRGKRRVAILLALIVAERRRNAALVEQLASHG